MNHGLNALTKLYGVINLLLVPSHRMLAEIHLQWKILLKNNISNDMLILLMGEKHVGTADLPKTQKLASRNVSIVGARKESVVEVRQMFKANVQRERITSLSAFYNLETYCPVPNSNS